MLSFILFIDFISSICFALLHKKKSCLPLNCYSLSQVSALFTHCIHFVLASPSLSCKDLESYRKLILCLGGMCKIIILVMASDHCRLIRALASLLWIVCSCNFCKVIVVEYLPPETVMVAPYTQKLLSCGRAFGFHAKAAPTTVNHALSKSALNFHYETSLKLFQLVEEV